MIKVYIELSKVKVDVFKFGSVILKDEHLKNIYLSKHIFIILSFFISFIQYMLSGIK